MTTPNVNSTINNVSFLRTTRSFPEEPKQLSIEVNRAYVDTANAVNARIVGIFQTNFPILSGESWYLQGVGRQQTFRQVYLFTSAGSFVHGINTSTISRFTRIYGTFSNSAGTIWYPLPYVDIVAATNQVNVTIDSVNINISAGVGAPTIAQGTIVIEWLSQP